MFFHVFEMVHHLFFTGSYSNQVFPEPLSLIEHNLRLVAHIVKKFDFKEGDQDDLISIGTIGLIKGVDTFSNLKSVKLTTYCARCIENEILMFFRSNNKNNKNVSLNDAVGYDKDGNEIAILDVLKTPKEDFFEGIALKDDINLLNQYFEVLSEREKDILIRRYGLYENDEHTQKEIAKTLHISRSYVSRIEKRALTKILREFIKNNQID